MCTLLFGLTSHLVYTGYVVLGLWLLALLVAFFQKRKNKWPVLGFAELLVTYFIVNWSLILEIDSPLFLAGGLGADNLDTAVRTIHPYAVDLSSSVETDGMKDRDKILKAVQLVHMK